jgi:hypothetical protein
MTLRKTNHKAIRRASRAMVVMAMVAAVHSDANAGNGRKGFLMSTRNPLYQTLDAVAGGLDAIVSKSVSSSQRLARKLTGQPESLCDEVPCDALLADEAHAGNIYSGVDPQGDVPWQLVPYDEEPICDPNSLNPMELQGPTVLPQVPSDGHGESVTTPWPVPGPSTLAEPPAPRGETEQLSPSDVKRNGTGKKGSEQVKDYFEDAKPAQPIAPAVPTPPKPPAPQPQAVPSAAAPKAAAPKAAEPKAAEPKAAEPKAVEPGVETPPVAEAPNLDLDQPAPPATPPTPAAPVKPATPQPPMVPPFEDPFKDDMPDAAPAPGASPDGTSRTTLPAVTPVQGNRAKPSGKTLGKAKPQPKRFFGILQTSGK